MQPPEYLTAVVLGKGPDLSASIIALAINWTSALSRRPEVPTVIPIPGASAAGRVEENRKLIENTDQEMAQIYVL